MTRARRRMAHRTRLSALSGHQRWAIIHGDRDGGSAFATPADWTETFDAVKDALLDDLDDPASTFRGFWRYDESVPDALRRDLHAYGGVMLPEPKQTEYRREYEALIEARRAWLREKGYR